ncbi:ATP-binding protein [Amycolatopsis sp. 195334CR]|uniref:ATP-binding protein n=1 Tax=Amycolatopsis sp. 195334CR TaxID=2814588 RepID=UPI001A8D0E4D|nr:ATP-binding protein [Amycolatopsis sp. 195334CR]MBN6038627.1 ATP-binding protein [Amycolatopsis sp. 195334CR]
MTTNHRGATLVATIGAPGAGKSTWRTRWCEANPHAVVVNLDRMRAAVSWCGCLMNQAASPYALELATVAASAALAADRVVLWDATSADVAARRRLLVLAAEHGARTVAVVHQPPVATVLARNAARSAKRCACGHARRVPTDVVLDKHAAIEAAVPSLAEEGWHVVTIAQNRRGEEPAFPVEWGAPVTAHQPRERHSSRCGRCSPSVESSPWPG